MLTLAIQRGEQRVVPGVVPLLSMEARRAKGRARARTSRASAVAVRILPGIALSPLGPRVGARERV
eukprot:14402414-Alexandrium_andersonii.AAC.1